MSSSKFWNRSPDLRWNSGLQNYALAQPAHEMTCGQANTSLDHTYLSLPYIVTQKRQDYVLLKSLYQHFLSKPSPRSIDIRGPHRQAETYINAQENSQRNIISREWENKPQTERKFLQNGIYDKGLQNTQRTLKLKI